MPAAIDHAAAVFVGTVSDLRWGGRLATVAVDDVWRGRVTSPTLVSGTPGGERTMTSVDQHYRIGGRYLFLPRKREAGAWQDSACSRTQEYKPELDALRPPGAARVTASPSTSGSTSASAKSAPSSPTSPGTRGYDAWLAASAAAVAAAAAWLVMRRRRLAH